MTGPGENGQRESSNAAYGRVLPSASCPYSRDWMLCVSSPTVRPLVAPQGKVFGDRRLERLAQRGWVNGLDGLRASSHRRDPEKERPLLVEGLRGERVGSRGCPVHGDVLDCKARSGEHAKGLRLLCPVNEAGPACDSVSRDQGVRERSSDSAIKATRTAVPWRTSPPPWPQQRHAGDRPIIARHERCRAAAAPRGGANDRDA